MILQTTRVFKLRDIKLLCIQIEYFTLCRHQQNMQTMTGLLHVPATEKDLNSLANTKNSLPP